MSRDTSSIRDIEEYMASVSNQNGFANSILNGTTSGDDDLSDGIEIVKELRVNLDKHDCALCSEGTFLVNKMLQFGGILNDEYKHACDICDTGFKTKADLNKHKKLHEDGLLYEETEIQDLTSLFNISNSYNTDAETPPSKSRKRRKTTSAPVVCDVCYKILKSERTLVTHKMNQHSNITYTCEVCNAKFTKFQQFKKHCATHSKSQAFVTCPTCNKQYLYKDSFKNHVCTLKT